MNRDEAVALAETLYRALASWDRDTLGKLLHPSFTGTGTAGLPLGLGGPYASPEDMIQQFWRNIGKSYEARAVPTDFSYGDDGRLMVHGQYEGKARAGGTLTAEFVHLLAFDGDRISSLAQITDSSKWAEALTTGEPTVTYAFDDGLATLTMNRPKARNAIDSRCADDLLDVALKLYAQKGLRAVLIQGNGPTFTVGGDIAELGNVSAEELPILLRKMLAPYHDALAMLDSLPAPIVAAVQGAAAGGGLGLMHVADIVIAAEGTRFAAGFGALGLTGDGSSSWFMPRILGPKRAAEFYFEGRVLTAQEAVDWGLINRVVPADKLQEEGLRSAKKLAAGPTVAFGAIRKLLRTSWDRPLDQQLNGETDALVMASKTSDAYGALRSFMARSRPFSKANRPGMILPRPPLARGWVGFMYETSLRRSESRTTRGAHRNPLPQPRADVGCPVSMEVYLSCGPRSTRFLISIACSMTS